jgi:hypothetical protein
MPSEKKKLITMNIFRNNYFVILCIDVSFLLL